MYAQVTMINHLLCFALLYFTLLYFTLLYYTLPYLTLPYLTLPYLTLPYLTLPYYDTCSTSTRGNKAYYLFSMSFINKQC